jgi:hypothetical protein
VQQSVFNHNFRATLDIGGNSVYAGHRFCNYRLFAHVCQDEARRQNAR